MNHVGFAVLSVNQIGMACSLQFCFWSIARGKNVGVRMKFVRAVYKLRPGQCNCVAPARTPFSCQEVIETLTFVEVWSFSKPDRSSLKNHFTLSDESALCV